MYMYLQRVQVFIARAASEHCLMHINVQLQNHRTIDLGWKSETSNVTLSSPPLNHVFKCPHVHAFKIPPGTVIQTFPWAACANASIRLFQKYFFSNILSKPPLALLEVISVVQLLISGKDRPIPSQQFPFGQLQTVVSSL